MNQPPPLIAALLEPARYPEPAAGVELVETHASWVLLAGDFAYKIKKPIKLPFLDYSSLARRRHFCEEELRLNRRFAPGLYLGLVEISGTTEQPQLGAPGLETGKAIEYALKMQRFDEAGRLDHLCSRGELTPEHIAQLVQAVVSLHRSAAVAPEAAPFGSLAAVQTPALDNIALLQTLLPDAADQPPLQRLLHWTQEESARLQPLLLARKAAGCIRECHGDLHLGNLVLINGRVTLFDCIDFNEQFRWIDPASEIAFTYIDLLDHAQPGLACWLLNLWLSATGDYEAVPLLRFYGVYRALVRAKVAAIRASQSQGEGGSDALARGAFVLARGYLALAQQLAAPPQARLIITHGLSGCGKSTAAKHWLLADPKGATLCLRSDVERKRLFGLAPGARSHDTLAGGIYTAEANQLTYQRLHQLAAQLLRAGWSVVVDAAFLRRTERADFAALATQLGVDFVILAPQADSDQLAARISHRLAYEQDASEATLAVLAQQQTFLEPLTERERSYLFKP